MNSVEIRKSLTDALRTDLIGPQDGLGNPQEVLPEPPSRWYLTGFIVPFDADETQKTDETGTDELDQVNDAKGLDDAAVPDTAAAKRSLFPSSIGLSLLAKGSTKQLQVTIRWGDYKPERPEQTDAGGSGGKAKDSPTVPAALYVWRRTPRKEAITLAIPAQTKQPIEKEIPNSGGLRVALSVRPVQTDGKDGGIPKGTRSVSLFLVNRRKPAPDEERDTAWAFQAQLGRQRGQRHRIGPSQNHFLQERRPQAVANSPRKLSLV